MPDFPKNAQARADTSAEHVERVAKFHDLGVQLYDDPDESGLRACALTTAALLRALLAERDAEAQAASEARMQANRMHNLARDNKNALDDERAKVARLREALFRIAQQKNGCVTVECADKTAQSCLCADNVGAALEGAAP